MDFFSIIYYNLNVIKNNLIDLIQKFENTLEEIKYDFNSDYLTIQFLSQYIHDLNKSHLNNDIIIQKLDELSSYYNDLNFQIQFWFVISLELFNNYLFINNIYQKLLQSEKKNIIINTFTKLGDIKNKYYHNSILTSYKFLIIYSSYHNRTE